jgi:hypothetical protein
MPNLFLKRAKYDETSSRLEAVTDFYNQTHQKFQQDFVNFQYFS